MNRELQYQNLAEEGDIIVENGTYLVENTEFNLTGRVIARNDAVVLIRNATLVLTTRGYAYYRDTIAYYLDAIRLEDKSRFHAENATIILKSANTGEESYITIGDDSQVNITDSKLYGTARIIGRQNSRTYVNRSILKGPSPRDLQASGILTEDNSTARIQDSELDTAAARGNSSIYVFNSIIQARGVSAIENGLIEVQSSNVGTAQWFWNNSTLRILNSTIDNISFRGSSLTVRDSNVIYYITVHGNSTAWLTNVSASRVTATDNSTVWLINSYAGAIDTTDQGKAYVGWQLPLFGIMAFPHSWLPILQGIAFLAALILVIALLFVLNRRWKKWQLQKLKQHSQTSPQS